MQERNVRFVLSVLILLCMLFGIMFAERYTQISIYDARVHFQEITGTMDVVIEQYSNPNLFVGNPHNVVFELLVDGQHVQAECRNGVFSPMVCWLYD